MPYKNIEDRRRNAREYRRKVRGKIYDDPVAYAKHREQMNAYAKVYREKNHEKHIAYGKKHGPMVRMRLKFKVLAAYGGKCYCCDLEHPAFLTIDHVNNDGADQRRLLNGVNARAGWNFYRWLLENNCPEGYRVSCYNCNSGRWVNGGICPHKAPLAKYSFTSVKDFPYEGSIYSNL